MNKVTFFALLLLLVSVQATKFYVSSFGSDDDSGKTVDTAFKSIKQAYSIANHNDYIYLAPGHYQGNSNCIVFNDKNITLVGPAKIQCKKGLRVDGANFNGVNITVNNVTVAHVDKITLDNSKISKGLNAYNVKQVILSNVQLTQGVNISTIGSDLYATQLKSFGTGYISIKKGGIQCEKCELPLFYLNTTKPTSIVISNSTFVGVSVYKLQTQKNLLGLSNFGVCNVSGTNVSCEDSGYSGMVFISSNCTVTNSSIENCTATFNNSGVAVTIDSSNTTFTNVTIQNNSGNSTIFVGSGSNFTMINSTVGNNWGNETTNGTGIFVGKRAVLQISNSMIHDNIGYNGAAIFISEDAHVKIEDSLVAGNRGYLSGDIACEKKPRSLVITNTEIRDNHAVRKVASPCFD